jgi:hypothetical protein
MWTNNRLSVFVPTSEFPITYPEVKRLESMEDWDYVFPTIQNSVRKFSSRKATIPVPTRSNVWGDRRLA